MAGRKPLNPTKLFLPFRNWLLNVASTMTAFKYRTDIDGLRGIAVLLVLLFHADIGFPGGYIGVDVFFVISGFLITGLILKKQTSDQQFSLRRFWERRIRRIIPAATCVVIVTLIVGTFLLLPFDLDELAESTIAQQLLHSNIYFWKNAGYFDGPSELKPLLHTWSLAVEEQFYLGFPFLLVILKRKSRRTLFVTLCVMAIASFVLSEWGVRIFPEATFFLLPSRAWELLLGAILVLFPHPTFLKTQHCNLLSCAGLIAIFTSAIFYNSATHFPGATALLPCLGASFIIYANSSNLTAIGRLLSAKVLVFVGLISYSLYLWHWPIFVFLKYRLGEPLDLVVRLFAIGLSFVLAYVSWRLVETPFRSNWSFANGKRLIATAGAFTFVLLSTAFWIDKSQGLPGRFSAEVLLIAEAELTRDYKAKATFLEEGGLPLIGNSALDEKPVFLMWGDSHLRSTAVLCDQLSKKNGLTGTIATHGGFPPLLDAWCADRDKKAILKWNNSVRTYIRSRGIKNVILIARWSNYIEGELNGEKDMLIVDSESRSISPVTAKAAFERCLRRTVESLQEDGINVWLMKQVPLQTFDPRRQLARAVTFGLPTPLGSTRKSNLRRHQNSNMVLDRLESPSVRVLDPSEYCFDSFGRSIIFDGKRSMYYDDNHLSTDGAESLLRPLLAPVFVEIAEISKNLNENKLSQP